MAEEESSRLTFPSVRAQERSRDGVGRRRGTTKGADVWVGKLLKGCAPWFTRDLRR